MKQIALSLLVLVVMSASLGAQENSFDSDSFIKGLNAAITGELGPGIEVKDSEGLLEETFAGRIERAKSEAVNWRNTVLLKTPEYGILVKDASGQPVELFGPSAPHAVVDGKITIPNYIIPDGGQISYVGQSGWARATQEIYNAKLTANSAEPEPTNDIQNAISIVAAATDYIAETLCPVKSRPTKLVLNITVGFKLAFTAETGSSVEWELDAVCSRYQRPD